MSDLDDIVEAVVDIEDIAEEVFEPDELIEDLVENTLTIVVALVAAGAALFTLLLMVLLAVLLALGFGTLVLVAVFMLFLFALFVTVLAVAGFLYVRTDIPSDVREKLDRARSQADDTRPQDGTMSEQEAIEHVREQYANGEINEHELEKRLDAVITSDQPEEVIREQER